MSKTKFKLDLSSMIVGAAFAAAYYGAINPWLAPLSLLFCVDFGFLPTYQWRNDGLGWRRKPEGE